MRKDSHEVSSSYIGGRFRRHGTGYFVVGGAGSGGRCHRDRKERRLRFRLLQDRRDVRAGDAKRGAPALSQLRQTRRAFRGGDDRLHQSHGAARDNHRRHLRGRLPGCRAGRRLRSVRDAKPSQGGQRVLLRGRCKPSVPGCVRVFQRPGNRRDLRLSLQVPTSAERMRANVAPLPDRTRRAGGV